MLCAIWQHLFNLKNVTLKIILHEGFSFFLNCTNGTNCISSKASHIDTFCTKASFYFNSFQYFPVEPANYGKLLGYNEGLLQGVKSYRTKSR